MTSPIVVLQPIEPTPDVLTSKESALKAHSQLLSVIVGKMTASKTASLENDPVGRTEACLEEALKEFTFVSRLEDSNERMKKVAQVQRKLSSIDSLKTFANLIAEVEDWDD